MSLVLGVVLGGISGFYGGIADTVIQRVIEILRSIPTIPLWMGLAAALPRTGRSCRSTSPSRSSSRSWRGPSWRASCAGRFLTLREEDFVVSARLVGCSQMRTIFVHMVPSFMSHIIAATTLALPAMIISETALSFLGLGLRPPAMQLGRPAAAGPERPDGGHLAVADAPGGARDHRGHGLQLPRGWPARCRRSVWTIKPSEAAVTAIPRDGAALRAESEDVLSSGRGDGEGGGWGQLRPLSGGDAGHRRRERVRQERDGEIHHGHRRSAGQDRRGRDPVPPARRRGRGGSRSGGRPREAGAERPGDAGDPRGRDRAHLPGADVVVQPGPHDREPDQRGDHAAPAGQPR